MRRGEEGLQVASDEQLKKVIKLVNAWYGVKEPEMLKRRKNDKIQLLRNKYFHFIEE